MAKLEPYAIREFRLRNNLTQDDLAQALGVDHNTVSRWELGQSVPDSPNMLVLALEGLEFRLALKKPETRTLIEEIRARAKKGANNAYERIRVRRAKS